MNRDAAAGRARESHCPHFYVLDVSELFHNQVFFPFSLTTWMGSLLLHEQTSPQTAVLCSILTNSKPDVSLKANVQKAALPPRWVGGGRSLPRQERRVGALLRECLLALHSPQTRKRHPQRGLPLRLPTVKSTFWDFGFQKETPDTARPLSIKWGSAGVWVPPHTFLPFPTLHNC